MNDLIGGGRYELIFEDERCSNREALTVANKFISFHKVTAVLGFPCNATLLAVAPVYDRAGITVLTSSGNSGDVLDIGKNIFRLFPSDGIGAELLYHYIASRHKKIAILTEQNEYPVMVERSFKAVNGQRGSPIEIFSFEYTHGETDIRTLILRAQAKGAEAIFLNANTDPSFISAVKQIRALKFSGEMYALYLPASEMVLKELGAQVNGFIFANLPLADQMVTAQGAEVMKAFRARFGNPQSGFPVVPMALESFRIFDLAVRSGKPVSQYLASTSFAGGLIPDYHFDQYGAVQGIHFELQRISNGKVHKL
jgi:ABC-type branched-subunit amino acid transport system substrate-binding protein